jgi:hypothetical protein
MTATLCGEKMVPPWYCLSLLSIGAAHEAERLVLVAAVKAAAHVCLVGADSTQCQLSHVAAVKLALIAARISSVDTAISSRGPRDTSSTE